MSSVYNLFSCNTVHILIVLPALTASTFSGHTATTAVFAPRTTRSTAHSQVALSRLSALSPVLPTRLAPVVPHFTQLLVRLLITLMLRVTLPTRTHMSFVTRVPMVSYCLRTRLGRLCWRPGLELLACSRMPRREHIRRGLESCLCGNLADGNIPVVLRFQ